jgi:hypothetical protein
VIDLLGSDAPPAWVADWRAQVGVVRAPVDEVAELFDDLDHDGISHAIVCLHPSTLDGLDAFAPVLDR